MQKIKPKIRGSDSGITKKPYRSEAQEQADLIKWANHCAELGVHPELKWLHAIPNGGRRDPVEAAHLKAQVVRAGVPDLFLPVPKGQKHGLYIEMKVGNNKPTENQKIWLCYLSSVGYAVYVCYSAAEAKKAIEYYLHLQ